MRTKKGLSGIVTTLIIILLVLVAVGVIWGVVNNLLGRSTSTISTSTKCLDVDIRATKVNETVPGTYDVTLSRKPTGEGEFGAYLVFFNDVDNSGRERFPVMLEPLETTSEDIATEGTFTDATRVEVTPFFLDESGKEILCQTTTTLDFK